MILRARLRLAKRRAGALVLFGLLLGVATSSAALDLAQRQYITVVGSSTAFPIVSIAAERFSRISSYKAPVLESTGTGGGIKLFCSGVGLATPDIVMASRPMKASEWERCQKADVRDLTVLKIGYDGITVANARTARRFRFTSQDLYLALAREVPDPAGGQQLVPNPYKRWSDISSLLADIPIRVLGPPPTSGTRDVLVERLLYEACDSVDFLHALRLRDELEFKRHCQALREDGAYVEAGENDARIVRKLIDDPGAIGILGYNFLDRNSDKLQGASIDGVLPRYEEIESGDYSLTRPLYLYIKRAHLKVVPGLAEFVRYVKEQGSQGEDSYLVDGGLIPLRAGERAEWEGTEMPRGVSDDRGGGI
ncbi:MAG: substrate-binding domain-containing protein [Pseudomonadota bacterium]